MAENAEELKSELDKAQAEYKAMYDDLVKKEELIEEKFGIKVYGKAFYKSKTFWLNAGAAGLAAYQIIMGHAMDEETYALIVVPVLTLIMRMTNTEQPLKL